MAETIDTRNYIYELQFYLRTIQLAYGERNLINPDGIYGSETTEAVRRFQQQFNLPVTGMVDRATWDRIYEEYLKAEELLAPAERILLYPVSITELKVGDAYDEIYILQVLLKKNEERHYGNSNVQITGVYDEATENAVRDLQRTFNLPQTGIMDKLLWNRFVKYHNTKYLNE